MIRYSSPLLATSWGGGGVPMANSEKVNPPKWRWLFHTDHFS